MELYEAVKACDPKHRVAMAAIEAVAESVLEVGRRLYPEDEDEAMQWAAEQLSAGLLRAVSSAPGCKDLAFEAWVPRRRPRVR